MFMFYRRAILGAYDEAQLARIVERIKWYKGLTSKQKERLFDLAEFQRNQLAVLEEM